MSSVNFGPLIETLDRWSKLSESERVANGDETRKEVQSYLASLPSQQLLSLLYGTQSIFRSHPLIAELHANNPRRRELLQAVYGDKWRAIESTYVRLPSEQKRLLVELLVGRMKKRYRWFSSRLLHAYAFRPQCFQHWNSEAVVQWQARMRCTNRRAHPLYSRVEIARRPGNPRILYVPAPPLKRLQREILETCLNPAMAMMPECIMGCRQNSESSSFGIFANASAHLGQQFVAKFDIKDFFPSVRTADIIETLQRLKMPMVTLLDEKQGTLIEVPWTHDAAVLVARLVTRFGNLPQGAPTSPAIANLVFERHDREIKSRIGSSIVYTRYVDDLTFSISRQVAAKLGAVSSADFLAMVQPIVHEVLEPTSFSLNDRKTRVSDLRGGHLVTGLSVGKTQVNLRRDTRKRLRGLLHRIDRNGVVPMAETFMGAERFAELCKWTSAVLGDMSNDRKTSQSEASIASFLRALCPKLVAEIPEQTFAVGTKRVIRDPLLHEGRTAIEDCLFFLPHLWSGEGEARLEGGHLEIRRTGDGLHLASLRAERNIELLALSSRLFHATLNLWLHLRGWSAGLNTPPGDSCFADVSIFRQSIQRCLDDFRIHLPPPLGVPTESSIIGPELENIASGLSAQPNVTALWEATHQVYRQFEEWARGFPGFQESLLNDFCRKIECPADNKDVLLEWFSRAGHYWRILPRSGQLALNVQADRIQRLVEVLHERLSGLRLPIYQLENDLLSSACRKHSVESLGSEECNQVQLQTLKEMSSALEVLHRDRSASTKAVFSVSDELAPRTIDSRMRDSLDGLFDAHEQASWREIDERVFTKAATAQLRRARDVLAAPVNGLTTDQVWEAITQFAGVLYRWTTDSLNFKEGVFSEEVKREVERSKSKLDRKMAYRQVFHEVGDEKKILESIFSLRNLGAHGEDPKHKQVWQQMERYVEQLLGKRPRRNSKKDNRLELTEFEGSEVKLKILQQLRTAIEKLKRTH